MSKVIELTTDGHEDYKVVSKMEIFSFMKALDSILSIAKKSFTDVSFIGSGEVVFINKEVSTGKLNLDDKLFKDDIVKEIFENYSFTINIETYLNVMRAKKTQNFPLYIKIDDGNEIIIKNNSYDYSFPFNQTTGNKWEESFHLEYVENYLEGSFEEYHFNKELLNEISKQRSMTATIHIFLDKENSAANVIQYKDLFTSNSETLSINTVSITKRFLQFFTSKKKGDEFITPSVKIEKEMYMNSKGRVLGLITYIYDHDFMECYQQNIFIN